MKLKIFKNVEDEFKVFTFFTTVQRVLCTFGGRRTLFNAVQWNNGMKCVKEIKCIFLPDIILLIFTGYIFLLTAIYCKDEVIFSC